MRACPRRHRIAPPSPRHLPVFLPQRAGDGLADPRGAHRKTRKRGRIIHDRLAAHAVDQLPADAGVDRSDQPQPQARKPRSQQRHRHEDPPHADLACVLPHELAVADPPGTADIEDGVPAGVHVERMNEVRDHITDRDRLGHRPDPSGSHHHRKPVDQTADQLERERTGADDDGGAKLDGGRTLRGEDAAHLVAAGQVGRKRVAAGPFAPGAGPSARTIGARRTREPSKVDDPPHPLPPGSVREVVGAGAVPFPEVGPRTHGVDQVVGGVDPSQGRIKRRRVECVSADDLGGRREPALQVTGRAGKAAHPFARRLQRGNETSADVSAGARDEDEAPASVIASTHETGYPGTGTGFPGSAYGVRLAACARIRPDSAYRLPASEGEDS